MGKIPAAYGFPQPLALTGHLDFWLEKTMNTIKEEVYLDVTMTSISTRMMILICCVDE